MKTTRLFSSAALMIGIGVAQLVACSSDSSNRSSENEAGGMLRLPLQTVAKSGNVYRLRNAFFNVVDARTGDFAAFLSSEDDPSRSTISKVLQTGDYTITLEPGWHLERVIFDGPGGTGGTSGSGGAFPSDGGRPPSKGGAPNTSGAPGKGGSPNVGGEAGEAGASSGAAPGKGGKSGRGGRPGLDDDFEFGGEFAIGGDFGAAGSAFAGAGGFTEVGGFGGFTSGGKSPGFGGTTGSGGSFGVPVDAHLLSDAVQFFGIFSRSDSFVTYSFQVGGEVLEFTQGRLNVSIEVTEAEVQCETPGEVTRPERVLLENNVEAVSAVTLRSVFQALASNGSVKGDAETLFNQIYDSYATADVAQLPDAVHCGDEITNGAPSLNGFRIDCNRFEAKHVGAIDDFRPLAIVNRIDLAPQNGANCGQQRMVFAHLPFNRAFMILEAQIPNPQPELGIQGCAPLAQFWFDQNTISDPGSRGKRLVQAFLFGDPELAAQGFGPFYTPTNLTVGSGQIRTNQFDSDPWTLREFKLAADGDSLKTIPFPTAEAPNGQLWNENSGLPQGPACRDSILKAVDGLLGPDIGLLSFVVDQQCKDAESRNDGGQAYAAQMSSGFRAQIAARIAGTGLSPEEVANRAQFAGSCIGCHNESSGAQLGNGVTAPFSSDFPHITEFPSTDCGPRNLGTQCFPTSTALKELFLPSRLNTLTALLGVPIITDPCENPGNGTGGQGGFGGGGPIFGSGGKSGTAGSFTAGGSVIKTDASGPVPIFPSQGPAPSLVIALPSANSPLSELVNLDATLRAKSGAKTIGGRSAQVTH